MPPPLARPPDRRSTASRDIPRPSSLDEVEADHIRRVLDFTKEHMGNAAEILGIHRNTLARKVREFEIDTAAEGG